LHAHRVTTVGQVARLGEATLVSMLGEGQGRHLHALAHNRDPRPVVVGRRRRSIGAQRALGRGPHPRPFVEAVLAELVDRVSRRMRTAGRTGRTVVLRLRFADFTRVTRSHTLQRPTSHTQTLLDAVRRLHEAAVSDIANRGLTLVGIAVANLDNDDSLQLELPFDVTSGAELDTALDRVRDRFGSAALTRASLLGRRQGPTVPLLPD
jgi:DNA polymerase-4